jgi:hypothetical protein
MTGIELITKERKEQIEKHGRTIEDDIKYNAYRELTKAAEGLLNFNTKGTKEEDENYAEFFRPKNWNKDIWIKMCCDKGYKERLIIAGALIAAELDRIIQLEK